MASVDSRRNPPEPRGRSPLASAIILLALYVVMYLAVAVVERMIDPVSAAGPSQGARPPSGGGDAKRRYGGEYSSAAGIEIRSAAANAASVEPVRCGRRGSDVLQCAAD